MLSMCALISMFRSIGPNAGDDRLAIYFGQQRLLRNRRKHGVGGGETDLIELTPLRASEFIRGINNLSCSSVGRFEENMFSRTH